MNRKKVNHKKYIHAIIFCILLFSISPYINSRFVNNEDNLRNSGRYEPSGLIALWSGPLVTIPDGWKLCDGSDGTLNISNRFVYSTDNMEEPGTTGGINSHNHNYTTIPYHDHGVTDTQPCLHSHTFFRPWAVTKVLSDGTTAIRPNVDYPDYNTDSDSANHSHGVDYTGQTVSYTSEEEDIIPPYYKLAFIEKETSDAVIPIGLIAMWAGNIKNIPEGWILCNGSNGTPDLRERFIQGVLQGEDPGSSGGSLSHNHTYTDISNHSHSLSTGGYTHSHWYTNRPYDGVFKYNGLPMPGTTAIPGPASSHSTYTDTPHTHTMNEIGIENCTTQDTDQLPPYFKIAFIMNKEVTDTLPVGSISMWGDSIADIPSCWNQCNGTYNMVNRFPRGIATGEQPGIIGGSATHRHIYTEVPLHTHTVFEDPMRHRHLIYGSYNIFTSLSIAADSPYVYIHNDIYNYYTTSTDSAPHNHTVTPTGSATCYTSYESNLPPYIRLIYIQKNLFIYNPSPADEATGIGYNPTLSVDASDLEGDDLIITFYNASDDMLIDADIVLGGSGTASVTWSGLSIGTSYSWYVIADDGSNTVQFDTWSFTTKTSEDLPLPLIITISALSAGTIIGVVTMIWLKKKKKRAYLGS